MKLCNICDHELTAGAFCPVCKSICRTPLILPDGVYLNKPHSAPDLDCEFHEGDRKQTFLNRRHPKHEEDCSYHNEEPLGRISLESFRKMAEHAKTGKSRDLFRK